MLYACTFAWKLFKYRCYTGELGLSLRVSRGLRGLSRIHHLCSQCARSRCIRLNERAGATLDEIEDLSCIDINKIERKPSLPAAEVFMMMCCRSCARCSLDSAGCEGPLAPSAALAPPGFRFFRKTRTAPHSGWHCRRGQRAVVGLCVIKGPLQCYADRDSLILSSHGVLRVKLRLL
jgi:hypothetical protein